MKADCTNTVVFNLHQIKRRVSFLGTPSRICPDFKSLKFSLKLTKWPINLPFRENRMVNSEIKAFSKISNGFRLSVKFPTK